MHGPLRAVCPHVLALHHLPMSPLGEHDAAIQSVFFTPQEQTLHLQIESSYVVVTRFQVLLVREKNYFSILGCKMDEVFYETSAAGHKFLSLKNFM